MDANNEQASPDSTGRQLRQRKQPKRNSDYDEEEEEEEFEDRKRTKREADVEYQDDKLNQTIRSSKVAPPTAIPVKNQSRPVSQPKPGTIANISQNSMSSVPTVEILPGNNEQMTTLNIPSHASWFQMAEIHEIEKRALPEFFDQRSPYKTPELYKEYRDFMITSYQQNPHQYLTQTACRRSLAGDVCSIIRVHSFLEYWGLINFNLTPDLCTPPVPASSQTTKTPMEQLLQFADKAAQPQKENTPNLNLASRKTVFRYSLPQILCTMCNADCSRVRYHDKQNTCQVCPNCFAQGKYPSNIPSSDFIKAETPAEIDIGEWTDQETLLLLEAIERFNEDWDAVAEHVATKSREQCILHFIRLPIEDPYLEDQITEVHKDDAPKTPGEEIPFSTSENPVMMMVAFLASVVSPSIASAAAQTALEAFLKNSNNDATPKDLENGVGLQDVKSVAAAALSAAILKAKLISEREEREIFNLVTKVVDLQLKKLEIKMKHFEEMEQMVDKERAQLERARQVIYNEQLNLKAQNARMMQSRVQTQSQT